MWLQGSVAGSWACSPSPRPPAQRSRGEATAQSGAGQHGGQLVMEGDDLLSFEIFFV